MKVIITFFCLLSLHGMSKFAEGQGNPGIQVTMHQSGIQIVKDVAMNFLNESLSLAKFGEQFGEKLKISNLNVTSFHIGKSSMTTKPPNQVNFEISQSQATVTLDWEYSWWFVSDKGTATVTASEVTVTQLIIMTKNTEGKPVFGIDVCNAIIGSLKIDIADTFASRLYEIALSVAKPMIKSQLQKQICSVVQSSLKEKTDGFTNDFKVDVPFLFNSNLNVALMDNPEAALEGITVLLKGLCHPKEELQKLKNFEIHAPPLPNISLSPKMTHFTVSVYVLNTLLKSMWQYQLFHLLFPEDNLKAILGVGFSPTQLQTDLTGQANFMGKSASVSVEFDAERPPTGVFNPDGIHIDVTYSLTLKFEVDGKVVMTNTTSLTVQIYAQLHLQDMHISGKIDNITATVTGPRIFPATSINKLLEDALPKYVVPALNNVAETGFKIFNYFGYKVHNAEIKLKQNALEIASDFGN